MFNVNSTTQEEFRKTYAEYSPERKWIFFWMSHALLLQYVPEMHEDDTMLTGAFNRFNAGDIPPVEIAWQMLVTVRKLLVGLDCDCATCSQKDTCSASKKPSENPKEPEVSAVEGKIHAYQAAVRLMMELGLVGPGTIKH